MNKEFSKGQGMSYVVNKMIDQATRDGAPVIIDTGGSYRNLMKYRSRIPRKLKKKLRQRFNSEQVKVFGNVDQMKKVTIVVATGAGKGISPTKSKVTKRIDL